jgi:hemoglobin/transferrin/lactoferrin receptor protein
MGDALGRRQLLGYHHIAASWHRHLAAILALFLTFGTGLSAANSDAEPLIEEVIVTASRIEEPVFLTPYSADTISAQRIQMASFRSTPDIFREMPGVLVQKTAHGQGSPYIRGFTGYRNLFMIDGIRLNNAVFRDGPNQYWATVDVGSIRRMEVVRGPKSVLYGSDAIGGTVNVLTNNPEAFHMGEAFGGWLGYRYANGEHSNIARARLDIALGRDGGLIIGGSTKDFGDIESGEGKLPNTGYDEWTMDNKLLYELSDNLTLSVAHFQVHQEAVPRTHRTIYSQPYKGTVAGSELRRDLDQDRILSYVRLQVDEAFGWENWNIALFRHQQEEQRERLRSGDRWDQQGVDVDTLGMNLAANLITENLGVFTAGADWAHDRVDSFSSENPIQGPVADDSTYDWVGIFLQNRYYFSDNLDMTVGMRLGYFKVDAGRISDPQDGSLYSYQDSWTALVGNIRMGWSPVPDRWRLYGGISQGFRAPNLSDLTRFDSARSNEFEIPSVDLDPERYTSYELGARYRNDTLEIEGACYYTDIKDQIQRLLTGNVHEDGEQEVTKANVGDGEIYGLELKASWFISSRWSAFGHYAWLDGKIDSAAQVGVAPMDDYHSRMMPTNYRLGVRYQAANAHNSWLEFEMIRVEDADRLSLQDKSDTQRIPPGGTPGYTLWHIRGGLDLNEHFNLNLVLENLLDENYRVHGSGQNETGRNFIVSIDYFF